MSNDIKAAFMNHSEITLRQRLARIPIARYFYDIYLILFKRTYFSGRMATCHNADFLCDPRFLKAYEIAVDRNSYAYAWNIMIACWAATQAQRLEGDFVECGTARGGTTAAIMSYLGWKDDNKKFYLFDTFSGLVEDQVQKEDLGAYNKYYDDSYEDVCKYFSQWNNVVIVKGIVPESLSQISDSTRVAYLHIDMNCAAPELAALEFFRNRMVPGGVILLDDYGWVRYRNQKSVHDAFAESLATKVLPLPTGQGIIIV